METFDMRIVDFKTNKKAESEISEVIDKYSIVVDDWMEKDYGIALFVTIPKYNRELVRQAIGNIHGVTYDE